MGSFASFQQRLRHPRQLYLLTLSAFVQPSCLFRHHRYSTRSSSLIHSHLFAMFAKVFAVATLALAASASVIPRSKLSGTHTGEGTSTSFYAM